MVRIDSTSSAVKTRSTEKARKTSKSRARSAASFAQSLSDASEVDSLETTETAVATAEAAGDVGLLALQERGKLGRFDAERTKKQAIAYGEGLIERLQALHVRLLSGVRLRRRSCYTWRLISPMPITEQRWKMEAALYSGRDRTARAGRTR